MVKWVRGCGEIKASRQIHSRRGRENSSPPRSVAAPAEMEPSEIGRQLQCDIIYIYYLGARLVRQIIAAVSRQARSTAND